MFKQYLGTASSPVIGWYAYTAIVYVASRLLGRSPITVIIANTYLLGLFVFAIWLYRRCYTQHFGLKDGLLAGFVFFYPCVLVVGGLFIHSEWHGLESVDDVYALMFALVLYPLICTVILTVLSAVAYAGIARALRK